MQGLLGIGVVGVVSVFVAPLSHGALSCLPVSCKHLCVCVCACLPDTKSALNTDGVPRAP